tara:strand:- start:341 stop:1003 length:663 start_codon:yes stop_codon:yes gene_type:complete
MFKKFLKIGQIVLGLLFNNKVRSGPFQGMSTSKNYFGSSYLPKVLGTYEIEITPVLYTEFVKNEVFIDIGCAGGYYMQLADQVSPDILLHGFDINEKALGFVKHLLPNARLENKSFDIECAIEVFKFYEGKSKLILMDIEGFEWPLLIDFIRLAKNYSETTIVVELHNHDKRAFKIPEEILENSSILDYRFGNKVPFFKLMTENEFRASSTQYLVWRSTE